MGNAFEKGCATFGQLNIDGVEGESRPALVPKGPFPAFTQLLLVATFHGFLLSLSFAEDLSVLDVHLCVRVLRTNHFLRNFAQLLVVFAGLVFVEVLRCLVRIQFGKLLLQELFVVLDALAHLGLQLSGGHP